MDNTDASWDDVSQTATTYSASSTATWSFAQFEYVIAVNVSDDPQVFQLGVSTEFADLAGSPPRAPPLSQVWGFRRPDGPREQRIGCVVRPERSYGLDAGHEQFDYQTFPDGGRCRIDRATNPLIFLEGRFSRPLGPVRSKFSHSRRS